MGKNTLRIYRLIVRPRIKWARGARYLISNCIAQFLRIIIEGQGGMSLILGSTIIIAKIFNIVFLVAKMTMLMAGIICRKLRHGLATFKARKILRITNSKLASSLSPLTRLPPPSKIKKMTTGPPPPQSLAKTSNPNGTCLAKINTIYNRCDQPLKPTTMLTSQLLSTTCRHHFLYKKQRQKIFNSHRISSDQIGTNTNHSKHLQSLKLS